MREAVARRGQAAVAEQLQQPGEAGQARRGQAVVVEQPGEVGEARRGHAG